MPRVSVIIPTYNRAHFLTAAIESVLAQTGLDALGIDIEIIVADDGSTDNTAEVVAAYGASVRYLPLPHRGQPAAPRNAGLAVATGEYIAFLDSDDLFLPQKITRQVPVLQANAEIGLVYSDGRFFENTPDRIAGRALAGLETPSGEVFGALLAANFVFMPLLVVRRALLEKTGGFKEHPDLLVAEDYDLWLRLARQTKFQFVDAEVAAIRLHEGNISGNSLRIHRSILGILQRLDQEEPALMSSHQNARHEAYVRQHGAIAALALAERRWKPAAEHLIQALWHSVQLPGLGIPAMRKWRARRRLRLAAP
jgi:GT2 family glycosyltransferase